MARIKIFVSQSADSEAVNALLSTLLVLVLKINKNDVKKFKVDFKTWVSQASGILTQLKIKKEFTVIANKFILNSRFSEEDAVALGKMLKTALPLLERDTAVTFDQLNMYKDCSSSLRTDSKPAWRRIEKNVSFLRNPKFNLAFLPEDQGSTLEVPLDQATTRLKELAAQLVGRPGHPFLTPKELMDLRKEGDKQELLAEYSAYLKEINAVVKSETFKFVRNSGNSLVPIAELQDYLTKKKIVNNLPIGFVGGQIDEAGNMYTKEGRQLDKKAYGVITPNPKYNPETDDTYVFTTKGFDGGAVRYRTLEFLGGNKAKRHLLVKDFFKNESQSRKRWLSDLLKAGSKEQTMAAMVEIMHQTASRIGGKDNATKGKPTYGLTTLQVQHVTITPSVIAFDYAGKKDAEQHHEYKIKTAEGKKILAIIKKLIEGKEPTDLVYTFKDKGKVKPITRDMVNKYLKSIGLEVTAHKFRHLMGTKITIGVLGQSPFKATANPKQAVVERWVKDELTKVGEMLHHKTGAKVTSSTAIKSYIDPDILAEFFNDLKLRVPKWVPLPKVAKVARES